MTQNVRGLNKTRSRPAAWFDGLRGRINNGDVDMVLLQETRAAGDWVTRLADQHARAWGLAPDRLDRPLSHWTTTPTAAGGVAVLFHPQSRLRALKPIWEDWWGAHFLALSGHTGSDTVTVVCVYAPTDRRTREQLFHQWSARTPPSGTIIMGGDFNCTLDEEADRSYARGHTHDSRGLRALIHRWGAADALSHNIQVLTTAAEVVDFHEAAHTYAYAQWLEGDQSTRPMTPCCDSDHDGVVLVVTPDGATLRRRRQASARRLRYPLPTWAASEISDVASKALAAFHTQLPTLTTADAAKAWDELKVTVRRLSLAAKHAIARTLTNSYRQQLRRLQRQLHLVTLQTGLRGNADAAQEGHATVASVRNAIIAVKTRRAAMRKRATYERYGGHSSATLRSFYARFSDKVPSIRAAHTAPALHDPAGPLAARLAADWLPILQQTPPTKTDQDAFFAALGPKPHVPGLADLVQPFTEAEVEAAVRACPLGKAGGPDGLPNDWYREHAEQVVTVLTPLFTRWLLEPHLPDSFRQAAVFCIPKVSKPASGLDYRPIALLNTDYKIFSRLLLARLKSRLGGMVSPTQFGFVPGRQVHDAVDVWTAVQLVVERGELPTTTTMVMLDFAKAYDTLDRDFLRRALRRHGLPDRFVAAVDAMHLATTVSFLGDGESSEPVSVHNGTRQGCPFAPVLFILALDCLYDAAAGATGLNGVELGSGVTIRLAGYADDTSAYLRHPAETARLLELLTAFGRASGLKVNVTKSHAVAAAKTGPGIEFAGCPVPVAGQHDLRRLLGALIASHRSPTKVWDRVIQQIRGRLGLAEHKTTDVHQRVLLCQAIMLPKVLFAARQCWPTASIVETLQRLFKNYVWHGRLSIRSREGRAWMSATTATLSGKDGGLGLPDVRAALLRVAAKAVDRWASTPNAVSMAVGRILLSGQTATATGVAGGPCRLAHVPLQLGPTLALTGRAVQRERRTLPREADELELLRPLLRRCGRTGLVIRRWERDRLVCDYTHVAPALVELERLQQARYGRLAVGNLMASALVGMDILRVDGLRPLRQADLRGLAAAGATIADVFGVERMGDRGVGFHCRTLKYLLAPRMVASFRLLCDALVFNYPGVLRFHTPVDVLAHKPASEHTWRIARTDRGLGRGAAVTTMYRGLATAWSLQALSGIQLIWKWRHSHHDGDLWSTARAVAYAESAFLAAASRVRRAVDATHGRSAVGAVLASFHPSDTTTTAAPPSPPPPHHGDQYVLFFDGGSRGNPGPGGAGSVVIRVPPDSAVATLVWSAAMSLAGATTTNNQAEYVGLLTGLRAAVANRWSPIEVVGDSMLVLRQIAQYRPPSTDRLRLLYQEARLFADRLGVAKWTHHLRAWNKMADAAANVAMDTKRSLQSFHPTNRPEWAGLAAHLSSDFIQWRISI